MKEVLKEPRIAVVHLVWLPFGLYKFKEFIHSYISNPTAIKHQLVLLFNGVHKDDEINPYIELTKENNIAFNYFLREKGHDLEVYHWICTKLESDIVLFLNSYSTFKTAYWLEKYMANFKEGVGLLSASGSYQSFYSTVFIKNTWLPEFSKGLAHQFAKYKLLVKTLFYWRFLFRPFPNPHLRTNAFMVKREVFIALQCNLPLKKKMDAYRLESGRKSITNQIVQMGYRAGVVGKDGLLYDITNLHNSNTFWQANQSNLLVADNQTELFSQASEEDKAKFTYLAWGKQ